MKILNFDKVKEKYAEVYPWLGYLCFSDPSTIPQVEKLLKLDKRYTDYSVYAIDKGKLIGKVTALEFDTKTKKGIERVGGIGGVCVHPKFMRKGTALKLLNEIHERFKKRNLRLSFLFTSKSIVAHNLYSNLGYKEFTEAETGFKFLDGKKHKTTLKFIKYKDSFKEMLYNIFKQHTKDLFGFTQRPKDFIKLVKLHEYWGLKKKNLFLAKKGNKLVGYVWADEGEKQTKVAEICAINSIHLRNMLKELENRCKSKFMVLTEIQSSLCNIAPAMGYKIETSSYPVLMVKALKPISGSAIRKLYDVDKHRFWCSAIDSF